MARPVCASRRRDRVKLDDWDVGSNLSCLDSECKSARVQAGLSAKESF
jgi:hypothetical protein